MADPIATIYTLWGMWLGGCIATLWHSYGYALGWRKRREARHG